MKARTAGCNRLICSLLLVFGAIGIFVYVSMLWEVARFLSVMHCQQLRQIWAFRNIGFAQIACLSALCNEGELDTCQLKEKFNCCEWKAQQMNTYCKSRQGAEQACVCLLFGLAWGLDTTQPATLGTLISVLIVCRPHGTWMNYESYLLIN